ncbi:aminotransferase class V-fold PLP-dependent enzyme [Lacticaseibacillus zhaodongensis]|uniref:aminotransferase class V-fold PLP-dependent enzyme n=1 Tax=Lacticaseibacillus zhaodongensis TaxID=2668065 RepID=UPI0012D2F037|nr:aminotransferase class V-fold PLP-dependent enzyme [Lacticaseibacillus zhaodongensis]
MSSDAAEQDWRADFPLFAAQPQLAYFDQAATGQYPQPVITALDTYMRSQNAPLHRGLYKLAYNATEQFEAVRTQVAQFINAAAAAQVIFTSGATAALNLIALAFGPQHVTADSEIIVSVAEHHSNFLPWQRLAQQTGAKLLVAPITANGAIDEDWVLAHINQHTAIVALAHETNVSGAHLQQAPAIAAAVHACGGYFVLDGAQAIGHQAVDVQALDCDFYVFSGHKIYGPSGTGCLYGRSELLEQMPPLTLGGGMVDTVSVTKATWAELPWRLEAGSQNALGVIGLGAAISYLQPRRPAFTAHTAALTQQLRAALANIPDVQIYSAPDACATVSFNVQGVHAHDLATFLDEQNVAIRAGDHCAQPLMHDLCVSAVARATLGAYTTVADCQRLVAAVQAARDFFLGGEAQ